MNDSMEENLVYIGTIENFYQTTNQLKLRDIATGYDIKDICKVVYFGFSRNFLEKIKIEDYVIQENKIYLTINQPLNSSPEYYINKALFIEKQFLIDTKPDFYKISDLLDCEVYDLESGDFIGKISDVSILPGNDVWYVSTDSGELPIPVIKEVVQKVDTKNKRVIVKLLDGLFDLVKNTNTKDE